MTSHRVDTDFHADSTSAHPTQTNRLHSGTIPSEDLYDDQCRAIIAQEKRGSYTWLLMHRLSLLICRKKRVFLVKHGETYVKVSYES